MGILAESRSRNKLALDPRNTTWSKDTTRFGHRMLEKMGWSKGKGLGSKEDGRTEHVKTFVKGDSRGVGCNKKHADNWIAHLDDFTAVLSQLSETHQSKNSEKQNKDAANGPISLAKKSEKSRARVHYHKFAKGKDLSSCKGMDLASILGQRDRSNKSTDESQLSASLDIQPSVKNIEESSEESFGVYTFNARTSVQDYFAKKMKKTLNTHNTGLCRVTSVPLDAINTVNDECNFSESVKGKQKHVAHDKYGKENSVEPDENLSENSSMYYTNAQGNDSITGCTQKGKIKKRQKNKKDKVKMETSAIGEFDIVNKILGEYADCCEIATAKSKRKKSRKNKADGSGETFYHSSNSAQEASSTSELIHKAKLRIIYPERVRQMPEGTDSTQKTGVINNCTDVHPICKKSKKKKNVDYCHKVECKNDKNNKAVLIRYENEITNPTECTPLKKKRKVEKVSAIEHDNDIATQTDYSSHKKESRRNKQARPNGDVPLSRTDSTQVKIKRKRHKMITIDDDNHTKSTPLKKKRKIENVPVIELDYNFTMQTDNSSHKKVSRRNKQDFPNGDSPQLQTDSARLKIKRKIHKVITIDGDDSLSTWSESTMQKKKHKSRKEAIATQDVFDISIESESTPRKKKSTEDKVTKDVNDDTAHIACTSLKKKSKSSKIIMPHNVDEINIVPDSTTPKKNTHKQDKAIIVDDNLLSTQTDFTSQPVKKKRDAAGKHQVAAEIGICKTSQSKLMMRTSKKGKSRKSELCLSTSKAGRKQNVLNLEPCSSTPNTRIPANNADYHIGSNDDETQYISAAKEENDADSCNPTQNVLTPSMRSKGVCILDTNHQRQPVHSFFKGANLHELVGYGLYSMDQLKGKIYKKR